MYIPFDELSDESRLWIYQAAKPFSESEKRLAETHLHAFCEQWSAHGHPLKTSFKIEYSQFILLAADESYYLPSGCSIDSSTQVVRALESETGISLLDRSKVAFLIHDQVVLFPLSKLKEEFGKGTLTSETLAFNNLAGNKREWRENKLVPAKNSWLARYLPHHVVAP